MQRIDHYEPEDINSIRSILAEIAGCSDADLDTRRLDCFYSWRPLYATIYIGLTYADALGRRDREKIKRQIDQVQKVATKLHSALDGLSLEAEIMIAIRSTDSGNFHYDDELVTRLKRDLEAMVMQVDEIGGNKGPNLAFDGLVADLGSIYQELSGQPPLMGLRRNNQANEARGPFFELVEAVCRPIKPIHSSGALGMQIARAMEKGGEP